MFTYALVLLFSIAVPVIRSFEKTHIHFIGKMRFFLPATAITAALFIVWDVLFTKWGVWGFTDQFLIGLKILGLPIEEWLFFIVIPYVCLFSYEVLNYFIKKDLLIRAVPWINWTLLGILSLLLILHTDPLHTLWSLFFAILCIALIGVAMRPVWMGRFYLMFAVIIIPFILVNGILTGSFIDHMVVWYNPEEIIGWRILTIPLEDMVYAFGMLLMVTALYEFFRERAGQSPWSKP